MSQIVIERNESRIELRGWIGSDTPTLCKSVPGARWVPTGKHWAYPLDLGVCRALRSAFGDALVIGPELNEWAREAIGSEGKLRAIADSASADLLNVPRYAPRIATAMANRPYQQTAAAFGARAGNFALLDQPGLGKTIEVLGTIIEANAEQTGVHLVLCPKVAVRTVWKNEIEQWLGDRAVAWTLSGTRPQRQKALDEALAGARILNAAGKDVFIIGNIEMARIKPTKDEDGKKTFHVANAEWPDLFSRSYATIIVDESHRALIRTSGTPSQVRAGMTKLRGERRIAISGTPMRGKPEQLWGTLNWIRPDIFGSYWRWVDRYFRRTSNGFSNYVLAGYRDGGEELMASDLRAFSLRRTKAEVLPELPPKQYAGTYLEPGDPGSPLAVWVEMDPKQAKQYRTLVEEGQVDLDGGELMANGTLALNTREKQLAGACGQMTGEKFKPALPSPKFDWLLQKLDEMGILEGEGESKIVVASQFTSLLNLFATELRSMGVKLHLLTGETPDRQREEMRDDFQSDQTETRVFLLNTKAGGVAITLDAADDLVLLDETYIPDDQEQVEDRIHRTSRMHNVTIHNLRTLDTIEEEIAWITAARADVMQYLLDGARGVEAARKIYEATRAA